MGYDRGASGKHRSLRSAAKFPPDSSLFFLFSVKEFKASFQGMVLLRKKENVI
jgi:hypothetical protein